MTQKTFFKIGALLIVAGVLTFTSCRRNKTEATPTLTSSDDNGGYASDGAKLEQHNNDIISIADAAATTGTSNLRLTSGYPTVTRTWSGTDTLITVDFGPTNHMCLDGKNRRGLILVTYSGRYKDSASTHTITTSSYYVNDLNVKAHKTVTNRGTNLSGQVWYDVTVNDTIVLASDSTISWTGTRTRTWFAGYSTATRTDDVYLIGGTTVLKRANGNVFTHVISTSDPLKVALDCSYVEAGTVTISSTSFASGDRVLNYGYGGGGCDAVAQLTIGTHTYTITLH